ncbi:MAG TPA: alkaline phosphatase family protein [Devosia sp.]
MNILLITADQWRGDAVGYAGNNVVRTPNLDALAAEGTAYLRHYSQAAPCSPARACLYTGLYQMNNRVCRNGTPLAARFDNIALAARRAGYDPTLFGYTDVSLDPTGKAANDPDNLTYESVLPGFTTRVKLPEHEKPWLSWLRTQGLELHDHERAHLPVGVAPGTISDAPPAYSKDQTQTAFLTGEFVRWLGEQERPWFAHLSFLRPHPPFIVPAPYNTMYRPNEVEGFRRGPTMATETAQQRLLEFMLETTGAENFVFGSRKMLRDLTEAEFRQIKATYYGMITEVDDQLGRAFAAIKARGEWDETLVIFTSDHAEMMGDHYALGKGGYFDESQHIPLVIKGSGFPAGRTVRGYTEAVDIFPTLLELMDVEPTHHPDGHSLVEHEGNDAVHWEFDFRDIAGQSTERAFGLRSNQLNLAVIRTDKWRYVHFAAMPPLLFDLTADPHCLHNVADDPSYAHIRIEMAERLLSWRAEHLDQTLAMVELTEHGVVRGW